DPSANVLIPAVYCGEDRRRWQVIGMKRDAERARQRLDIGHYAHDNERTKRANSAADLSCATGAAQRLPPNARPGVRAWPDDEPKTQFRQFILAAHVASRDGNLRDHEGIARPLRIDLRR